MKNITRINNLKTKINDMKNFKKSKVATAIVFFLLIGIGFSSCNKEEDGIDENLSATELSDAYETTDIDDVSENINDIVESAYFELASNSFSKSTDSKTQENNRFMSDCVTITKVITAQNIEVTLDYGDGCTTKKEDVLSGKIQMFIVPDILDKSVTIDYSFENFYFNSKKIEGTVNKVRIKSNENDNPQAIINRDFKIIWEDGSYALVQGERTREWIEGYENLIWSDNVFSITGKMTITKRNGDIRTSTIIKPLIKNMACKFLVSGVLEIEKNEKLRSIDYGDGECDDLAILTSNGNEYEIHIRKKKR